MRGVAVEAGKEDADAADEDRRLRPDAVDVFEQRNAAGHRGDAAADRRAARGPTARRTIPARAMSPCGRNASGTLKRLASAMSSAVPLMPSSARMRQAVAALQFDVEQIDGRRMRDVGRKMAADTDRGDDAGAKRARDRVGIDERILRRIERIGHRRIRFDLALGDRRLAERANRARRERGLIVRKERRRAGLGDRAVDGKDARQRIGNIVRARLAPTARPGSCRRDRRSTMIASWVLVAPAARASSVLDFAAVMKGNAASRRRTHRRRRGDSDGTGCGRRRLRPADGCDDGRRRRDNRADAARGRPRSSAQSGDQSSRDSSAFAAQVLAAVSGQDVAFATSSALHRANL